MMSEQKQDKILFEPAWGCPGVDRLIQNVNIENQTISGIEGEGST